MHHIDYLEDSRRFVIAAASMAAACMVFGHPALLPVGVVAGFVVAALAREYRVASLGFSLSALALGAVLMAYTRSMLLSVVIMLAIFMFHVAFPRKNLSRAVRQLLGLVIVGVGVIALLNIETMRRYRMGRLADAAIADGGASSVTSRLEEYRIAWVAMSFIPCWATAWEPSTPSSSRGPREW